MPPTEVDQNYLAGVRKRLDPLFAAGPPESFDAVGDRLVVFSDHHRGTGGGEDDFRRCEHAYTAALGFYLESDYRLLLLGDVEELWEVAQPERIFTRYEHVLGLERSFAERGKLERFWGNHDDLWANEGRVRNRLRPVIGPDAPVRETLKMKVECPGGESGTVFFAHGHQGTPESDSWVSKLTRLPVRFIWPLIQRFFNASATTPAQDHELRGRHDTALFHWAAEQPGRILVAGHTHRPVFSDSKPRPPVTRPVRSSRRSWRGRRRPAIGRWRRERPWSSSTRARSSAARSRPWRSLRPAISTPDAAPSPTGTSRDSRWRTSNCVSFAGRQTSRSSDVKARPSSTSTSAFS